jgi:predicted nucleic acid-binding protein
MKYFIDTNFIIDVFEREILDTTSKLTAILQNSDHEIFYNGLVYLETLRTTLDINTFRELKSAFEFFKLAEINQSIYDNAMEFSRYCRSQPTPIKLAKGKCEAIDLIHFMTAKYYGLELLSKDCKDMQKLAQAHTEWLKSTQLP